MITGPRSLVLRNMELFSEALNERRAETQVRVIDRLGGGSTDFRKTRAGVD